MVSTVIAVSKQVQNIWLEKYIIHIASFHTLKDTTHLKTSFQIKAFDVKAVSVWLPDESVLEVGHDLLPRNESQSHDTPLLLINTLDDQKRWI